MDEVRSFCPIRYPILCRYPCVTNSDHNKNHKKHQHVQDPQALTILWVFIPGKESWRFFVEIPIHMPYYAIICMLHIHLVYPSPSNSQKWRFIRIPYQNCHAILVVTGILGGGGKSKIFLNHGVYTLVEIRSDLQGCLPLVANNTP